MYRLKVLEILLSVLVITLIGFDTIHGGIGPRTMNYQGRLTDDQGQPVTNTVSMTFTIYDAETDGNSKWTEIHPSVSVVDGLFSVVLGQGDPSVPIEDTVFISLVGSNSNRWLEVIVDVGWLPWERVKPDHEECSELLAIFTSINKH